MVYYYSKLELYKRAGDKEGDWETTASTYTNFFGKNIKKSMGTKKDTFKFNLLNNYNKFTTSGLTFEKGDRVKIYQAKNTTTITPSDLLIDGVIKSVRSENSTNKVLTIEGASRTEQFLEALTFVTDSSELTPPEILEKALSFHNNNNKNFIITWSSSNPTTKSDGSAFPTYFVEKFYSPMNLLYEKYSSNEYTKDGNYYYYINDDNELIWRKKTKDSPTTLEESSCESIKVIDNNDQVINSLIIFCGRSPYGKPIRTYKFDYSSRAKNGAKWKYITKTNTLASDLMKAEKEANPSSFDDSGDRFPNSYPYTTKWGVTCNSDDDYEKAIIDEATRKGKEEGLAYLQGINQSRLKITVQLPFTNVYTLSTNVACNFPSYDLNGEILRVTDIQYTDYNTILTLLQDETI